MTADEFVAWLKGYFELGQSPWVDDRNRPLAKSARQMFWGEDKIKLIQEKLFSVKKPNEPGL
jgi:hypothetical protein